MRTSISAGDSFGDLTVTRRDGIYCVCLCKCDPDREVRKRADNLKSGATRSCGRCVRPGPKPADHTGERFGIVHIIEMLEDGYVRCQCDCDEDSRFRVRYDHLKAGHRQSCGCNNSGRSTRISPVEAENLARFERKKQDEAAAARAMGFTVDEDFYWVRADGKRFNAWFDRASGTWLTSPR
jgi:hypothetical protein